MAGRPKKTTTTTETNTKVNNDNNAIDMSALMAQMAEMQKQIAELTHQNQELNKQIDTEADEDEEINGDTEIAVASQFRGKLNLTTAIGGTGNTYTFDSFGEIQDIPFADLKEICKINKRFAQEGIFYILNDNAVKKLRLKSYYNKNISYEDMKNLGNLPSEVVLELYKTTSSMQQDEIVDYFRKKYEANEDVDANILFGIEKASGGKVKIFRAEEE